MCEIFFYHLERQPLEVVLPALVQRSLERGWRVVIQTWNEERLEALDLLLWTFSPESFLPHGSKRDGNESIQPVYLTLEGDNPNRAAVRFLVDGATIAEAGGHDRLVHLFDGNDNAAVEQARLEWRRWKAAGRQAVYWRQDESGRWQKGG
jgi:DNA polymerase-3 subunit chi